MDYHRNFTVDQEESKGNRIRIWGNIFQKYERRSIDTTEDMKVKDIEQNFPRITKDFNIPLMQKIVKRKRGPPKSHKVNRKVLKLDKQLKSVHVGKGVRDVDVNLQDCIGEENVRDVTHINTMEEFRKHRRLVKSFTNQNLFETSSESDCSGEVLRVDGSPEDDWIGKSNLVGEQSSLSHVVSQNVKQIQTDEIVPQAESTILKKSYKMKKLHDKDGNSMNTNNQICSRHELVEKWLNKSEQLRQIIPSRDGNMVFFPTPAVPSSVKPSRHNNTVVLEEGKTNHCNGESKGQDYIIEIGLISKQISPRINKSKFCRACNNHNSPKKADICFIKQEGDLSNKSSNQNRRFVPTKVKLEDCSSEICEGKSFDGIELENRLGKEMSAPQICKSSKEIENCCTQKEKPKMNSTYPVLKYNDSPNVNPSKGEAQLNSKIKLGDLQFTGGNNKNVESIKIENRLMEILFYKRTNRAKRWKSSREVHFSPTKQSSVINDWPPNTLKSENSSECSTIILNGEHFQDPLHVNNHRKGDPELLKHNHRILKASNSNMCGQLDESSRINSIPCLSRSSNTSTAIKDVHRLPPTHNKDDMNYFKIKNKIENEFKSKLGYMVYKRHELRQNLNDSNKVDTEFWDNSVKSEILKLSQVIPTTALMRYMKECVNSPINSSG